MHTRMEIAVIFEKNIAFSFPKCYNRYIPKTKEESVRAKTATVPSDL